MQVSRQYLKEIYCLIFLDICDQGEWQPLCPFFHNTKTTDDRKLPSTNFYSFILRKII